MLIAIALLTCAADTASPAHRLFGSGELDELPQSLHAVVDSTISAIAEEDWPALYRMSAPEIRARTPEAAFVSNSQQVARATGKINRISTHEVHLYETEPGVRPSGDGPLRSELVPSNVFRSNVRLVMPSPGKYAFVLGETVTATDQPLWVTVLLSESEGSWQIFAWHFNHSRNNGHDGYWFVERAGEFEAAGQTRNAHLYRVLARQLLIASPYVLAAESETLGETLATKAPPNLPFPAVRPAESWRTSDTESLEVYLVMPVALGVVLGVEVRFHSEMEDLESDAAHRQRERLAEYVKRNFPEYVDAFDGIYVATTLPIGNGFRDYFPFAKREPPNMGMKPTKPADVLRFAGFAAYPRRQAGGRAQTGVSETGRSASGGHW